MIMIFSTRRKWLVIAAFTLLLAGIVVIKAQPWSSMVGKKDDQASILYLSDTRDSDLWVVSVKSGEQRQLTTTGGKVFDYNVSQDGSLIVFSVQNEQKGIDLWEMDRQGKQPHMILPCHADWCINPAYSPDGEQIAYSRRRANVEGSEPDAPQVWMLERTSGSTDPLYTNPNIGGFHPVWSPDGHYLAFFDGISLGVRVLDMSTMTDFLLESQSGVVGEWSPDSTQLLYINSISGEELPYVVVYRVDVKTQQVETLLGGEQEPVDYSVPVWSPDGGWLAFAQRSMTGSPSKQMWLMRSDRSQLEMITSDPIFTYAGYQWSPDGEMLVCQRLELGASASRPQVAIWSREDRSIKVLAEDAFQPRWLP